VSGCSLYAVDVQDARDPTIDAHRTGEHSAKSSPSLKVRLAVVVKRKVITFQWGPRDETFREVQQIVLAEQPKAIAWAANNLVAGLKKECVFVLDDVCYTWTHSARSFCGGGGTRFLWRSCSGPVTAVSVAHLDPLFRVLFRDNERVCVHLWCDETNNPTQVHCY
jgi:hypothetical protein